jgi:hypothetical protein
MSNTSPEFDCRAMQFAAAAIDRHQSEVELAAAISGAPRRGWALLERSGLWPEEIANVDTYAIFLAIQQAAAPIGRPWTALDMVRECRRLLRAVDLWDENDERSFVTLSLRWGPGPLFALLCRVAFDPEHVDRCAANLREADCVQSVLLETAA